MTDVRHTLAARRKADMIWAAVKAAKRRGDEGAADYQFKQWMKANNAACDLEEDLAKKTIDHSWEPPAT